MNAPAGADGASPQDSPQHADAIVREFAILNKKGLHARPSVKFGQTVERFDAQVQVSRGSETVGGTSIMGLMMLCASTGSVIQVAASGPQAAEVMAALEELIAGRFGEEE
jgi:phosphocarrier protein HPr